MKSREELDRHFEECIARYVDSYDIKNELAETCNRKYKLKLLRCQMIISGGAAINEIPEIELFWILDCLQSVVRRAKCNLEEYFSEIKIEQYRKTKQKDDKIKFPIRFNMVASGEDKWIGSISAKDLVLWRNSGYLRYNKNIQRRVKTILRGGKYVETIDLNLKSVNDMVKLFKEGKFISNVLTFNINEEDSSFYYDPETKELVIEETKGFDMTDGYHRLVALEKVMEDNPNFDYLMELRITCFSEEKANYFIWQEEQRTPMVKSTIKSYNMDDIANKIARKVNETSSCNMSGNITRGGLVELSTFSDYVDYYYIKKMKEKEKKVAIVTVTKELIECINILTDDDPSILTRNLTNAEIAIMIFTFKKLYEVDKEKIPVLYKRMINHDYGTDKRALYQVVSLKTADNVLERVYSLEASHV